MSQQTVTDALVEYLISRNVTHVFGVLAHTLFPIGDAMAKLREQRHWASSMPVPPLVLGHLVLVLRRQGQAGAQISAENPRRLRAA
ncbi:MAG: hypothetical protein FJ145_06250 [Deltaproteobacteria bacterium]|nr:hypothetical protein [Deltaproteobacteria bacterium]